MPKTKVGELMPDGTRSDGCTGWPDGPWHACCVEHDRAYRQLGKLSLWRAFIERRKADLALASCVASKGHPIVAALMFVGVRIVGWPIWLKRWLVSPW